MLPYWRSPAGVDHSALSRARLYSGSNWRVVAILRDRMSRCCSTSVISPRRRTMSEDHSVNPSYSHRCRSVVGIE